MPYTPAAGGEMSSASTAGASRRAPAVFREICTTNAPDDGVTFMSDTVQAEVARAEDEYSGLRVTLKAVIAGARLPMQVDIGFGDTVTPAALEVDYPSLLDMPTPRLRAYPPETVVAEKVQAMVALGMLNSRMKDFFDVRSKADQLLRKRSYPIDVGSGRCEAFGYEAYYHGTIEPMAEHE